MASSDSNKNCYPYERLDGYHIRVLDLQPGRWSDDIHAHLRTVSRICATYEALSYVWGPTTQGRTLYLDKSHQVSVTDNLFLALRRLRNKQKVRTLWVDAVCINQLDDIDKSYQVAKMAQTYKCADIVNIWLGESTSAKSTHLKCAFGPDYRSSVVNSTVYYFHRLGQGCINLLSDVTGCCQSVCAPNRTKSTTEVVQPWCTRAWTLQEYFVARRIRLCLGDAQLPFDPWHEMRDLKDKRKDSLCSRLGLSVEVMDSTRRRFRIFAAQTREYSLIQTMKLVRNTSATDERDTVSSILGILQLETKRLIPSNYLLSYAEVCATPTAAGLKTSTIELLAYVEIDEAKDATWVSWAVDFARTPQWRSEILHIGLIRSMIITSFESMTLGILGRTLGVAAECKPITISDVRPILNLLIVVQGFFHYTNQACGSAYLVKLSNGTEVLAPAVVQAGDLLVRLCYTEAFDRPYPELFIWLRPHTGLFIFRGLGLILGDTVYTGDYEGYYSEEKLTDDRTRAEIQAGFETFLVR